MWSLHRVSRGKLVVNAVMCGTLLLSTNLPARQANAEHVIVISVDGLSPVHYMQKAALGLRLPHLSRLLERGSWSDGMVSSYPSVTYPAHATLATGMSVRRHGIAANSGYINGIKRPIESGNHYREPPIWRLARTAGLRTGSVFWPVTADEPIDALVPEAWWESDKGNDALRLKKQAAISTPGLLDSLMAHIGPPLQRYFESDTVKTTALLYILDRFRPNLALLHYSYFDYRQHVYGPKSPEALETLEALDEQIGRIVAEVGRLGLSDRTAFFIVSDHGHAEIAHTVHPGVALVESGLVTLDADGEPTGWEAMVVPTGGACAIVRRESRRQDLDARIIAFAKEFAGKHSRAIEQVFSGSQLDSLETGAESVVVFEGKPGYAFGGNLTGSVIVPSRNRATHGYLPQKAEMFAGFIAAGAGVGQHGNVGRIDSRDLYPTIGKLLGLACPPREGQALVSLFRK